MSTKYTTFEVRQGDTFHESLIMEDTNTGVATNITNATITGVIIFPAENVQLDVVIVSASDGSFSISKSAADTATWPVQDGEGYITIEEAGVKTSSDNFTVRVIRGAV